MNNKIPFYSLLIFATLFLISCSSKFPQPLKSDMNIPKPKSYSANCGPKVLLEVCKAYGIEATEEELAKLSDTVNGESSFYGLSNAAKSKGLQCIGAKVSFDRLKSMIKDGQVIAHYSQNHHFILIKGIDGKKVSIYDPGLSNISNPQIPIHLFLDSWDGNVLIINKELNGAS